MKKECVVCLVAQLCLTIATLWILACQTPLSMGILQARILEWGCHSSSRGSSQPRDLTQVSRIVDRFFTVWVTREAWKRIYSCINEGGTWWAAVHGVTKSWTWLSDFTFTFHFHALEKEMATHSSVLAWRIPGTGEPGGLPSIGSHRVGHDWSDLAAAAAAVLQKLTQHCKSTILQ